MYTIKAISLKYTLFFRYKKYAVQCIILMLYLISEDLHSQVKDIVMEM